MKHTSLLGKSTKMYSSVLGVEKYMIFYNSSGFLKKFFFWTNVLLEHRLNDHLKCNPNHYLPAAMVLFISLWSLNDVRDHIRNISVSHRAIFSGFFLQKRELNYPNLKEYQHMHQLCIKSNQNICIKHMQHIYALETLFKLKFSVSTNSF